jgi:nitroreductase
MNFNHNDTMTAEAMEMESALVEGAPDQDTSTILDVLRRRWSPKGFSNRRVEPAKLRAVLEAARWAPSSHNEQPWSFVLATKENAEAYNLLLGCLHEKNRQWAQHARVLILSVAKMYREIDGKANRYAFHDVGLATASLMIQATALGLYTHPMGGFSVEKAREVLVIPEGYEFHIALIAMSFAAALLGPGTHSLDYLIANRSVGEKQVVGKVATASR